MNRAVQWLLRVASTQGVWSYGAPPSSAYDYSNTQYAVLALKSATRCGIRIPNATWSRIAEHFLNGQEKTGPVVGLDRVCESYGGDDRYEGQRNYVRQARARGWGYVQGQEAYGSMTAAGVASLVLAQSGLFEARALGRQTRGKIDVGVRDGLAWLGSIYSLLENPRRATGWFHYYLYGLERAMILSGTRTIGGRDWYRDGALVLVKTQNDDGSWSQSTARAGTTTSPFETCFALLFLKRATTPVVISTGD